MTLARVIYASRPFGFDDAMLNGILTDARRHNDRAGITGALICRPDLYLQLLEGPPAEVEALYARIARDERHLDVERLVAEPAPERLFPSWAMRDDPARSWLWTTEEVADGALSRATRDDVFNVFVRLAAEPA